MRRTNSWELRTFVRVLCLASAAFAIALLVTAASDEGGITWHERLARTVPATPLIVALASALEVRRARGRGELRALAASGASPWQCSRAAAMAGATFAVALAASLARLPTAVAAFFPHPLAVADYRFVNGAFVEESRGWSIAGDGALTRIAMGAIVHGPLQTAHVPPHATLAAIATLVLAGFGLSLLATRPWSARTVAAWARALVALTCAVIGFHYAAATGADALPVALVVLLVPLDAARIFWRPEVSA